MKDLEKNKIWFDCKVKRGDEYDQNIIYEILKELKVLRGKGSLIRIKSNTNLGRKISV